MSGADVAYQVGTKPLSSKSRVLEVWQVASSLLGSLVHLFYTMFTQILLLPGAEGGGRSGGEPRDAADFPTDFNRQRRTRPPDGVHRVRRYAS
eukprot:225729-Rhodomonas_salina.6